MLDLHENLILALLLRRFRNHVSQDVQALACLTLCYPLLRRRQEAMEHTVPEGRWK